MWNNQGEIVMKRFSAVLLIIVLLFVGCESNKSTTIPSYDKMKSNLINKGYTIEEATSITIDDKKISAKYINATNGDNFIRICYEVSSEDSEKVYSYFESINGFNSLCRMDDIKIVYVCTDKAMKDAGITIVDVKVDVKIKE